MSTLTFMRTLRVQSHDAQEIASLRVHGNAYASGSTGTGIKLRPDDVLMAVRHDEAKRQRAIFLIAKEKQITIAKNKADADKVEELEKDAIGEPPPAGGKRK